MPNVTSKESNKVKTETATAPLRKHLKDYRKPDYLVKRTELEFDLDDTRTVVYSRIEVVRNQGIATDAPLVLNGVKLKLLSLAMDGNTLPVGRYELREEELVIPSVPAEFTLEIRTEIDPLGNKALEGLYKSSDIFCTQMEPEGFRKVTYYVDRPDNLSRFRTTIRADKVKYPHILSNGNLVEQRDLGDGRHMAIWEDPFLKPCYLYALVAGNFAVVGDCFTTRSGRKKDLRIYVDKGNEGRALHAMESLKKSMKWDEDTYGLEYDLDLYMIVAVDAFNFGAMENKGLNIFNSNAVLADAASATDDDFFRIEGIVAHEYFHNWTGNRVTCRDWFQLTLKEGLTVFRDQSFSMDMHSAGLCRIQDVIDLRNRQFAEDSGPTAHPIRPGSYIEINNFYTATVYNKGAEVIRMLYTMLGRKRFRKAIDLYFARHDGSAVTTEDFVRCMQEVYDKDLAQFERTWYNQARTPVLKARWEYDEPARIFRLHLEQSCPALPGQEAPQPFHIPVKFGLLSGTSVEMPTGLDEDIIHMRERSEVHEFRNIPVRPVPSLLRGFSAPVKLEADWSEDDLMHLFRCDSDPFSRHEAGQILMMGQCRRLLEARTAGKALHMDARLLEALGETLGRSDMDDAFKAEIMTLPSMNYILESVPDYDPQGVFEAREFFARSFALKWKGRLLETYQRLESRDEYRFEAVAMGRRSLRNACLAYLSMCGDADVAELLHRHFSAARNMTDKIAALNLLCHEPSGRQGEALAAFEREWQHDPLVMNKWFMAQAWSKADSVLARVRQLEGHRCYDKLNPNKIRALVGAYAGNLPQFHRANGEGYSYIADKVIEIEDYNPFAAASLSGAFKKYSRLSPAMKGKMEVQLRRIADRPGISREVYEIVSRILEG